MERNIPHGPKAASRQQQIQDCLYENMHCKPYHSISVADLCRQVGISRKAFYNYYRDKETCLYAIVDDRLQRVSLHLATTLPNEATLLESTCAMLDYWKSQKDFLDLLFRNDLMYLILLRGMEYIQHEEGQLLDLLSTPEIRCDGDILSCYMSCQLTLIIQWYLRSFDTPTQEMAKKLLRIMHSPMLPAPPDTSL